MFNRLRQFFAELLEAVFQIADQLEKHNKLQIERNKLMAITNERLLALETALKEAGDEIVAELETLRKPDADAEAKEASMQRLEALGEKLRNISPPVPPTNG